LKHDQFEDILIYFSKSLLGKENEDDILWDLAKNCIAKLGFVDCVIYLIDEENNLLEQRSAYGPKNPKDQKLYNPVKIALGEGITGNVAITGVPEIVADTSMDSRYIVDDDVRLSEICVPISHEKVIYGVIDCEHPDRGFFTDQHLKMLSAVASICAIKIKSVRANNALLEKQHNLLKVREEMIDLKLKALNSQLNPHFVFNALNAIQHYIASENKKLALEYLSIFSKLIRYSFKSLDKDSVHLKDEIEMLHWYLKLQKLRYNDQFEYKISIDDTSKRIDATIPSSLIQTLFENIIEYGIFNQHKNKTLDINFEVTEEEVILNIEHQHDRTEESPSYTPEYRKRIMEWQDQIDLLNTSKGYNITKDVIYYNKDAIQGEKITMTFPNLS